MSFGLSRGRERDTSGVEIPVGAIPPLPDDAARNPASARLDVRAWFDDPALPLQLEIGSGKATFLVQEVPSHPGFNWIGIEYAREFFAFGADRVRRAGLKNVKMLCLDAAAFVHWRLPDRCLRVLHLYFPDPWPKRRHNKRRMVSDAFLADCTRVLEVNGELRVATDHADYWAWMAAHFDRWCGEGLPFDRVPFKKPAGAREGEVVGTNFERKYILEGRTFNATTLRLARPDAPHPQGPTVEA